MDRFAKVHHWRNKMETNFNSTALRIMRVSQEVKITTFSPSAYGVERGSKLNMRELKGCIGS